jgi:hypothetical protein
MNDRARPHAVVLRSFRSLLVFPSALLALSAALSIDAGPLLAQKTDTVVVRNGDVMTGEIKEYQRGIITYDTDAASTIHIKWQRILTLQSRKQFDIYLADGTRHFGSLRLGDAPNQVKIVVGQDTMVVATQSIVSLERIKSTVWKRLDGSVDLGVDFTQQNAKTDLSLSGDLKYKIGRNNFELNLTTTFSRQDSADNISKLNANFVYLRELRKEWFYQGLVVAEQNSQMSLDIRGTVGGGAGRFLVHSNKVLLATSVGLTYARERFSGQDGDNLFQGYILADFQLFSMGGLTTTLSNTLVVVPVISQAGRWRISNVTSFKREIITDFYFNVSLNEFFDSKPPTEDTNKNDFSVTTSFGISF